MFNFSFTNLALFSNQLIRIHCPISCQIGLDTGTTGITNHQPIIWETPVTILSSSTPLCERSHQLTDNVISYRLVPPRIPYIHAACWFAPIQHPSILVRVTWTFQMVKTNCRDNPFFLRPHQFSEVWITYYSYRCFCWLFCGVFQARKGVGSAAGRQLPGWNLTRWTVSQKKELQIAGDDTTWYNLTYIYIYNGIYIYSIEIILYIDIRYMIYDMYLWPILGIFFRWTNGRGSRHLCFRNRSSSSIWSATKTILIGVFRGYTTICICYPDIWVLW